MKQYWKYYRLYIGDGEKSPTDIQLDVTIDKMTELKFLQRLDTWNRLDYRNWKYWSKV
jgi:hypothetical protein